MKLNFQKWHGCRNDFVVVNLHRLDASSILGALRRSAEKICDRHGGIGADGILALSAAKPSDDLPEDLMIINSDGSLAKNCGNGLRCAAAFLDREYRDALGEEQTSLTDLKVEERKFSCQLLGREAQKSYVSVDMGLAMLNSAVSWCESFRAAAGPLLGTGLSWKGAVDLGNPHIVIVVDEDSAWNEQSFIDIGRQLQALEDGVNVHFFLEEPASEKVWFERNVDEAAKVFHYERGAGVTAACGSGACAVGVLILDEGLAARESWIEVNCPGGGVYVYQQEAGGPVQLAGPAQMVYSGTLNF